jgi:peptidoglycan/xylan/chitin deacetylase (PgdA/CDA1 family)
MRARHVAVAATVALTVLIAPVPAQAAPGAPCEAGYVRLTFDDGPSRRVTPAVLDTLEARSARATFFVVGQMADANPALVRRAAAEGYRIGNHTWDHPDLTKLPRARVESQLRRTSEEIVAATGVAPTEWRPPYGRTDAQVTSVAASLGLTTVLWTIDPRDWQNPPAETIRDRVLGRVRPGSIVLLHDGFTRNTAAALPMILDGLTARGLCTR